MYRHGAITQPYILSICYHFRITMLENIELDAIMCICVCVSCVGLVENRFLEFNARNIINLMVDPLCLCFCTQLQTWIKYTTRRKFGTNKLMSCSNAQRTELFFSFLLLLSMLLAIFIFGWFCFVCNGQSLNLSC